MRSEDLRQSLQAQVSYAISSTQDLISKSDQSLSEMHVHKSEFLLEAQKAAEEDYLQRVISSEHQRERLEEILRELRQEDSNLSQAYISESFLSLSQSKLENLIRVLKDEEFKIPSKLDFSHQGRSVHSLESKVSSLERSLSHKKSKDMKTLDNLFAKRIDSLISALNHYNVEQSDVTTLFQSEEPSEDYASIENLNRLKMAIITTLRLFEDKMKYRERLNDRFVASVQQKFNEESYKTEISNLNLENQMLAEHNAEIEEYIGKLRESLDELDFKYKELEFQYETLKSSKQSEPEDSEYTSSREIENVKKIYNDKYEELFRLTNRQINELENRLTQAEDSKDSYIEEETAKIKKIEESLRLKEIKKMKEKYSKEVVDVREEFKEFIDSARFQLRKIAKRLDKTQHAKELLEELEHFFTSSKFATTTNLCKRCGNGDAPQCVFHPYLVRSGTSKFLYGVEWHKCRVEKHSESIPGCLVLDEHYNGKELSQSNQKGNLENLSNIPHEKSATFLLDSYLSKYV